VPFGHRVKPEIFNEALLRATSAPCKKAELESRDFRDLSGVARRAFHLFDPPINPFPRRAPSRRTPAAPRREGQSDLADLYAKLDGVGAC